MEIGSISSDRVRDGVETSNSTHTFKLRAQYNEVVELLETTLADSESHRLWPRTAMALDDTLLRLELWEAELSYSENEKQGNTLEEIESTYEQFGNIMAESLYVLLQSIRCLLELRGGDEPISTRDDEKPIEPNEELFENLSDSLNSLVDLSDIVRSRNDRDTVAKRLASISPPIPETEKPSHTSRNLVARIDATFSGEKSERSQEPLDSNLIPIFSEHSDSNTSGMGANFYTSGLGDLDYLGDSQTSFLSATSDTDDQQHKRQNRTYGEKISKLQETSLTLGSLETRHPPEPASIQFDRYKLQSDIFNALVPARNPEVFLLETGFLPKAQLDRLINEESVARELCNYLSYIHTVEQIKSYAKDVCSQSEAMHNGKLKLKSFRKIFALLVLTETSSSISMFLAEDVSDLDLPLAVYRKRGTIELGRRDPSGKPSIQPLRCFSHHIWSPTKRRNFEQYQWTMLAPFFSQGMYGDVRHYSLQDQHILPFIASPDIEGGDAAEDDFGHSGGFESVFTTHIHEEHRNFHDPEMCQRGFTVKRLHDSDPKIFRKRAGILKKFSGERSHPHIVPLLATYEQFTKYYFIFYRAEGHLLKYWKEVIRQPELIYDNVLWMAKQFAGLADGLLKLHIHLTFPVISNVDVEDEGARTPTNERYTQTVSSLSPGLRKNSRSNSFEKERPNSLNRSQALHRRQSNPQVKHTAMLLGDETTRIERYGLHGNLNPRNVLWYDDPDRKINELKGTLMISNFGQPETSSQASRSRQFSVARTGTYHPPECDIQPHMIRQSYDIWCLGCVYLEFVTWILGGEKLLRIFSRRRRTVDAYLSYKETDAFFQLVNNPENGNLEAMVKLSVTKFIDELHQHPKSTDYIHRVLFLIQYDMLVVEPDQRKPCQEVCQTLDALSRECLANREFATKSSPWTGPKVKEEPMTRSIKLDVEEEGEQSLNSNHSLPHVHPSQLENLHSGDNVSS